LCITQFNQFICYLCVFFHYPQGICDHVASKAKEQGVLQRKLWVCFYLCGRELILRMVRFNPSGLAATLASFRIFTFHGKLLPFVTYPYFWHVNHLCIPCHASRHKRFQVPLVFQWGLCGPAEASMRNASSVAGSFCHFLLSPYNATERLAVIKALFRCAEVIMA